MQATTTRKRECAECGGVYSRSRVTEDFCSTRCRKTFNNRRAVRGAALYDLFMIMRNERGFAKAHGVWNLMCRLAMYWKESDEESRDGRKTWRNPKDAIQQHSWARATVVSRDVIGQKK